jgi:hypothetical protein
MFVSLPVLTRLLQKIKKQVFCGPSPVSTGTISYHFSSNLNLE